MIRPSIAFLVLAASVFAQATESNDVRMLMDEGVQAYHSGRYPDAVADFRKAIAVDADNTQAHFYLATALMAQYGPGRAEDADQARSEFMRVLALDPRNTTAIASLASLAYEEAQGVGGDERIRKLDAAREWYQKLIGIDPSKEEAYYWLGAIDYLKSYSAVKQARAQIGMKREYPGPLRHSAVKQEAEVDILARDPGRH